MSTFADRTTRQQLQEALDCIDGSECTFFACPGPDVPFLPMATCRPCRTTQLLRRACARLGIPPLPPIHERVKS
jgi:hypothetical protein